MGILDIFFGKEEEKEEPGKSNLLPSMGETPLNTELTCPYCENEFQEGDKVRKWNKKLFHRKCLKKLKKEAKKMRFT